MVTDPPPRAATHHPNRCRRCVRVRALAARPARAEVGALAEILTMSASPRCTAASRCTKRKDAGDQAKAEAAWGDDAGDQAKAEAAWDDGYGLSAPTIHMAKNWEPPP